MIISRAILAPLRRIAENAGINGPVIIEKVQQQEFEIGYNAAKNTFGNMYEEGVVDPAKVTRSGLQNATSIASMILTTECIIVDDSKNFQTNHKIRLKVLINFFYKSFKFDIGSEFDSLLVLSIISFIAVFKSSTFDFNASILSF
jgi:hypothetical protein